MTPWDGDVLDTRQRVRAACVYAAIRSILNEEPFLDDLLALAQYIETGYVPPRTVNAPGEVITGDGMVWVPKPESAV